MTPRLLLPVAVAFALAACGGSKQAADEPAPTTTTEDGAAIGEPSPEEKLLMQQAGACRPMCERLTACSVEDARANMSPEEFAELEIETTAPRHTDECDRSCNANPLSPRQIQVIRDCVSADSDCQTFVSCLDAVSQGG